MGIAAGNQRPCLVRARAYKELVAAVGQPGIKACREMTAGIGTRDSVRGTAMAAEADKIAVRIDDAGRCEHMTSNQTIAKGAIVRGVLQQWSPCL